MNFEHIPNERDENDKLETFRLYVIWFERALE